jgi:hypothetical protein
VTIEDDYFAEAVAVYLFIQIPQHLHNKFGSYRDCAGGSLGFTYLREVEFRKHHNRLLFGRKACNLVGILAVSAQGHMSTVALQRPYRQHANPTGIHHSLLKFLTIQQLPLHINTSFRNISRQVILDRINMIYKINMKGMVQ